MVALPAQIHCKPSTHNRLYSLASFKDFSTNKSKHQV